MSSLKIMMGNLKVHKIALPAICLVGGFVVGVLMDDMPYVQFKKEVDLSTLISLLGLIGAIYIIPFLINTYFSKRANTNQVIISDMDACLDKLEKVAELYKKLYLKTGHVTRNDMKELLSDLRRATNCIAALAKELDDHPSLKNFRNEVFEQYNENTYKDHTENTREGAKIDDQNYLAASRSIEETILRIKRFRYLIYSV